MSMPPDLDAPLWRAYLSTLAEPDQARGRYFGAFAIGDSPASADEGARLILCGRKTATSELALGLRPLPETGQLSSVVDGRGAIVAIVETTSSTIRAFDEIDASFAGRYGQWGGTLSTWRAAARDHYRRVCADLGREWHDSMPLGCELIRIVYPRHTPGRVVAVSERLELRQFAAEDAEGLFELNRDPEAIRYTGDAPFADLAAARDFTVSYDHYERYGFGRWSVFLRETGAYLGFCGLRCDPDTLEVDLGFRIARPYWGQGYATEAARLSIDLAFSEYGLESVVARAMPRNAASHRVIEKCGFLASGRRVDDDGEWLTWILRRAP